jgi:SOS-response transcriptional repressor LexA
MDCLSIKIVPMKRDWGTLQGRVLWAAQRAKAERDDIIKATKATKQAVGQWFIGPTQTIRSEFLLPLSAYLKVDPDWLNTGKGSPDQNFVISKPDYKHIPVLSYVQAGDFTGISDDHPVGHGLETITVDFEVGEGTFTLIIRGESMLPIYREGDQVIIDPTIEPIPGDMVVAKLDNEESITFKKYRPKGKDKNGNPIIELVPLNEDWPTLVIDIENPGKILGVEVQHRRNRPRRK